MTDMAPAGDRRVQARLRLLRARRPPSRGAAIENGQVEIDANVIEYVPVTDEQAPERFAARRAFERATGLTEVGAARPESYAHPARRYRAYRTEQGLDDLQIAAQRWFGEVFRPLWQTIRARELTAAFPGDAQPT